MTTPTPKQYDAAQAAIKVKLDAIAAKVPAMFQHMIPHDFTTSFSAELARTALDAAAAPPSACTGV